MKPCIKPRGSRTLPALPALLPAMPPVLLPALLAALLSGCAAGRAPQSAAAAPPPFGSVTRAALAQQIAHPDAARQAQARGQGEAAGMDGRAAGQAQGRYQKSFGEAAPQQSSFTIGVSGAK
ncbi:hypothetical protein ASC94_21120 [Massilia sp. Root418]|uniref:hypothetical protein n=1 Tax=Massilia sp. Root418 TaxID=1736532 RepID=UPI0006FA2F8E|nr:hypothetical protein [Massilia sp. Root418]KQW90227.1 hypothetical protein ASC94_21120 [Massilia sp. Root418]